MARDYGRIMSAIWSDGDWRALSVAEQHAYVMLVTQADINSAGVLSVTLRRWSGYTSDSTPDALSDALSGLESKRFIAHDANTEELLVRKFVKWDGGAHNEKRQQAIRSAASAVVSPQLRAVLAAELDGLGVRHGLSQGAPDGLSDSQPDRPRLMVKSVTEPEPEPEPETITIAPTASSRARDEIWDALLEACGINGGEVTAGQRGSLNRAVADLKAVGATPEQVKIRAVRYRAAMPEVRITPPALAKHWAALSTPQPPKSPTAPTKGW